MSHPADMVSMGVSKTADTEQIMNGKDKINL